MCGKSGKGAGVVGEGRGLGEGPESQDGKSLEKWVEQDRRRDGH